MTLTSYTYLIVGGGMTADAACKGIRAHDGDGSIGIVSEEAHPPYARPPLSKGLWKGDEESSIWRGTADLAVELQLGRRIVSLDLAARRATDDLGGEYAYERLLLATGGSPRRLPFDDDDGVVYFRTLDDYRLIRERASAHARFVVIGGGFIGSEIAAALSMAGAAVTLVFPGSDIGTRIFPAGLAAFVTDTFRSHGVEILAGRSASGIERADGGSVRVSIDDGSTVEAEVVVAGLGIEPNSQLATDTGLPVDEGIVVDDRGRVGGRDDLFAAGDVARFPSAALGGHVRVEHEDHANSHGRQVGANMAGADEPYDHLPFFYSDLFNLGYEAVGELDSRHETVAEWKSAPNGPGVVCYVDSERRPRGFLLWGLFGLVDDARELIRAGAPLQGAALRRLIG